MEILKCKKSGMLFEKLSDCTGENDCKDMPFERVKANSTDAAQEKHIPLVEVNANIVKVKVGSVEHPMTAEHSIVWVAIVTNEGIQRKYLKVDGKPEITFALCDGEKLESVYAYCNLHGLWVKQM